MFAILVIVMKAAQSPPWKVLSRFVEISSPWLTVIGERLRDDSGKELEYWRVEKAHSLVVITVQNGKLILPNSAYRPGVGRATVDFCGGRVDDGTQLEQTARRIVCRELALGDEVSMTLTPINQTPWDINSSFENQQLYGYVVELGSEVAIDAAQIGSTYELNEAGVQALLHELVCLQCRALLREWLATRQ